MSCPNCGNELQAGEAFCGLCGTPSRSPTSPVTYAQYDSIPSQLSSLNHLSLSPHSSSRPLYDLHQDATEALVLPSVQTRDLLSDATQQYSHRPISSGQLPTSRRTSSHTTVVLGMCICVVVALIGTVSGFILYGEKHTTGGHNQVSLTSTVHTTPTPSTLNRATPTPVPATPTASALAPTPVPDAGFIYCGVECNPYGFMDEYPNGWQMVALPGVIGVQFVNPLQPDQVISYKKLSTAIAPDQLLTNEIQTMYAGQPGYQPATSPQPQTIGGQPWLTASIGYQMNQQQERVTVCTSVYQNQSYILELQAPEAQFEQVSVAYYNLMVGKFQFS